MKRVSFSMRIKATIAVGMVLVLFMGLASYVAIDQLAREASEEILSYQAVNRAETLLVRWKDTQASHRRLLASRADADEAAYRMARSRTVDALAFARSAFSFAGDSARFAPIEESVHQGLAAMDQTLEAQAAGSRVEAEPLSRADGPATESGIEGAVQAVRDIEVGRIEKSHAQALERAAWSRFAVAAATLFSLAILGLALVAIARNRARRKEVESRLRTSELQLRLITDAVPCLIAYVDSDRRFHFHNKAYEEYFGLGTTQIDGRPLWEVIGDEVYAAVREKVDEALAGYPVRYEQSRATPRGQRDFAVHLLPRYGDGERAGDVIGFYSLMTDVTDLKRIDRMKTEFVSTVSHELRTPLTSIRGSLGLIAGGVSGALPEPARKLVDIAKNNCERLIRLINDILDTEKIESGKMRFEMKELQLGAFIADALQANEGFAAQHGVRLRFAAPDEPIHVDADADRLNQVLANLLSNAIKFSPRGAEVVVTLTRPDARARVEIRDHGPGIPEEFRGRIFQKFSQADASDSRQKGGTGLGLNISKAIVERLNGTIGFASETGAGTTFHFDLPAKRDAVPASFGTDARTRPCVLVCEDDPDIAHLLSMIMEKAGFDSEVARLGAEALELAKVRAYAAMTVDLRLPDMDGIALIRTLRREPTLRDLPIVVVSARADEGRIQVNSEALSVTDWLAKPIDENRLVAALLDAVDGERRAGPRVLHVEDDPDIQRVAATIAADFASFEFAGTLQEARHRLGASFFDLVLLDLKLPDGSGWDLVPEIRRLEPSPRLVVFSVDDVSTEQASRADAVLLKSYTSNEKLTQTLRGLLPRRRERAAA